MSGVITWAGHPYLGLSVRAYLATVFLLACWHKIVDPAAFALDIATYQILPLESVNLMAIVLPWVELAAGLMLLVGLRTRAAALLVTGMLLMFTLAVSLALAKGLDMSCGCFASQGVNDDPISWRTILRDSSWLVLSIYLLLFDRAPLGVDRWLRRRPAGPRGAGGRGAAP